jgi:hypothetical protein
VILNVIQFRSYLILLTFNIVSVQHFNDIYSSSIPCNQSDRQTYAAKDRGTHCFDLQPSASSKMKPKLRTEIVTCYGMLTDQAFLMH